MLEEQTTNLGSHKAHSVKVPRLYKVAAGILKDFDDGKDSIKNLVFNCRKHPNTKALFALVMETVNHHKQIEEATNKIQLFENEPRFNRQLAFVLINELIWGKETLPGSSLPVQTVLKYKKRLKKSIDVNSSKDFRALDASWPRYARVNTLCNSFHRVTRQLREEGWLEVMYDRSEVTFQQFLELLSTLSDNQYLTDLHIPGLLVFPPKTALYDHPLVLDGSLMLQDKASCFPVAALSPPPGVSVLDACSAPGMKTSQLAAAVCGDWVAALGGSPPVGARVVAVERSSRRFSLLSQMIERSQAKSVTEAVNADFLNIDPAEYADIEYIVLDPSCSGTGMVKRGGGHEEAPGEERLHSLASVQSKLLRHALSFPAVKKVVYSTCAVSEEENEKVVTEVLKSFSAWEVLPAMPGWERRGLSKYPDGSKFVRASGEEDWCNGFFVAVLGRVDTQGERGEREIRKDINDGELVEENTSLKKKKKKKKEKSKECENLDTASGESQVSIEGDTAVKRKKSKNKVKSKDNDEDDAVTLVLEKKKKKKKKKSQD